MTISVVFTSTNLVLPGVVLDVFREPQSARILMESHVQAIFPKINWPEFRDP